MIDAKQFANWCKAAMAERDRHGRRIVTHADVEAIDIPIEWVIPVWLATSHGYAEIEDWIETFA